MANVDYKLLKNCIIKSCNAEKDSIKFNVNHDKLASLSDDIGLIALNVGVKSKKVNMDSVNTLSEYFKGPKLSWFGKDKEFTILTFLYADTIDEECQELIDKLHTPSVDDPDIDHVNILASIIAKYPCYSAIVVSYMNNGPKRFGRPSYEIKIRANTVAIKQQLYEYNHNDMV
jgi:hypothetical protein